jgi:hypothetical protein
MVEISDPVDEALALLGRVDASAADAAKAAYDALTWGEGLASISQRDVQEFLWYQLPTKWMCGLHEKVRIASSLGRLFDLVGMQRYAAVCASAVTTGILTGYDRDGYSAGLAAHRRAMRASGVEPPDVPGILVWGSMQGVEESNAFTEVSHRLELALAAGDFRPGGRGWRGRAETVAAEFLLGERPELSGESWLERVRAERLSRWTDCRGPSRRELTAEVVGQLAADAPVPADAGLRLAPVRWLLAATAADKGALLTQNGRLGRALVAEGCDRFGWLTLTPTPRSEADIVEAWTLRSMVADLRATRRRGRALLATQRGRRLAAADDATLWSAVVPALIPPDPAEAAAAEIMLLLLLTDDSPSYQGMTETIARTLAEEGWADADGQPPGSGHAGSMAGELHRRLSLLGLLADKDGFSADRLSPAGRAAARSALRAHALRPRD